MNPVMASLRVVEWNAARANQNMSTWSTGVSREPAGGQATASPRIVQVDSVSVSTNRSAVSRRKCRRRPSRTGSNAPVAPTVHPITDRDR